MRQKTSRFGSRLLRLLAVLVVLAAGMMGGIYFDREVLSAFVPLKNMPAEAVPDFRLMAEAWNTIQRFYVDRSAVKPKVLTYGAISGMVDALGDTGHSTFLSPGMVSEEKNFERGEFKGIGAEVQMKQGHVVIVAPIDGSPAQQAGLHPGDIIMKVNGKSIAGLSLEQVVSRITGPAGTSVSLTILSPASGQTHDMTVVRKSITLHNVTWRQLPGTSIAHLRIAGFSKGITEDLRKALTRIPKQGLTGIILDLRNNPGGLLSEAIDTTSQFIGTGNALLVRDAKGKVTSIPVEPNGLATEIPLAVLINGGTASAAEIVSGAIKDDGRAKLVGETTFGTGTVLAQFNLSDGSALLLAIEEWLTPNGHTIWHEGITPNLVVPLPPDVFPLFPESERDMTHEQLMASKDQQLLRALALLMSSES